MTYRKAQRRDCEQNQGSRCFRTYRSLLVFHHGKDGYGSVATIRMPTTFYEHIKTKIRILTIFYM